MWKKHSVSIRFIKKMLPLLSFRSTNRLLAASWWYFRFFRKPPTHARVSLTHWSLDKWQKLTNLTNPTMHWSHIPQCISQTTFSIAFRSIKTFIFWFKFHWNCFWRSYWQEVRIGSGNGLGPNRRRVVTWINVDTVHWRIYAALGEN